MKFRNSKAIQWGCAIGVVTALSFAVAAKAGPGFGGSITGYKFEDTNSNGMDDGEPRIPGVTILLNGIDDPSVIASTVTDANGDYGFFDLPIQSYSVCEVAVPPMVPTTPECVNVELTGKSPHEEVIFGNHLPSPSPSPSVSPSESPSPSPTPSPSESASPSPSPSPSESASPSPSPSPSATGCVRTQGFWGSSPAGKALVPILVPGTMNLGTTAYTAAQLASILNQPAGGNALLILADQLIAAKLNILAGADGTPVATTIADADAAIDGLVIPPVGTGFVAPSSPLGQTMTALAATLDSYNNGNLGVPHCP